MQEPQEPPCRMEVSTCSPDRGLPSPQARGRDPGPPPTPSTGMGLLSWVPVPLPTHQAPWEARKHHIPHRLIPQPLLLTSSFPSVQWDYWGITVTWGRLQPGPRWSERKPQHL